MPPLTKFRHILSVPQTILATLFDVGKVTIEAFFPHPYYHHFCSHTQKTTVNTSLYRLRASGLIQRANSDIFYLTPKGQKKAFSAYVRAKIILRDQEKAKKWDGKWRVVIFDVPEKKRNHRDYLRSFLKMSRFKELQKSIWVSPYKIPDFLIRLIKENDLLYHTRFFTTCDMSYDNDLRKKFLLK